MVENHQVQTPQPSPPQPTPHPWTRQPDEPSRWYDRFNTYRAIGPGRSILGTYKVYRRNKQDSDDNKDSDSGNGVKPVDELTTAPPTWYTAADTWNWKTRATAFDQYNWDKSWGDEEKLREQSRQLRITAATTLLETALRQVQENGLKEALSPAIKTAMRELREELEGHSTRSTIDVNIILAKLQPELQKLLQSALKPNK